MTSTTGVQRNISIGGIWRIAAMREMSSTATPALVRRKGRAVQINPMNIPSGRISTLERPWCGPCTHGEKFRSGLRSRVVERVRHKACSRFEFRNRISFSSREPHKTCPARGTSPRPIAGNAFLIAYFNGWRQQAISLTLRSRILETAIFSGLALFSEIRTPLGEEKTVTPAGQQ